MCIFNNIVSLFIFIFISLIQSSSINCQENINQIIDLVEFSENTIETSQGSFLYEWIKVDSLSYTPPHIPAQTMSGVTNIVPVFSKINTIEYISSGIKKCIKIYNTVISQPLQIWAYNGEKTEQYNLNLTSEEMYLSNGIIYSGANYPKGDYDILSINNLNISQILRGAEKGSLNDTQIDLVDRIQEDVIDGVPCKGISVIIKHRDDFITKNTYWIAPKYDYKPVKIEVRLNDTGALRSVVYYTYTKYDSILFPSIIRKNLYSQSNNEDVLSVKTIITFHKDWKFNHIIDDNKFDNIFPSGLSVSDRRSNKIIIID